MKFCVLLFLHCNRLKLHLFLLLSSSLKFLLPSWLLLNYFCLLFPVFTFPFCVSLRGLLTSVPLAHHSMRTIQDAFNLFTQPVGHLWISSFPISRISFRILKPSQGSKLGLCISLLPSELPLVSWYVHWTNFLPFICFPVWAHWSHLMPFWGREMRW